MEKCSIFNVHNFAVVKYTDAKGEEADPKIGVGSYTDTKGIEVDHNFAEYSYKAENGKTNPCYIMNKKFIMQMLIVCEFLFYVKLDMCGN